MFQPSGPVSTITDGDSSMRTVNLVVALATSVIIIFSAISCVSSPENRSAGVVGAWQIAEVELLDGSAPVNKDPLPNLVLFTDRHYSMVWLPGKEAQRAFATRWHPTDSEKVARYNAIVVNTGTYEVNDSILTMHPIVARVPEFMGGIFKHRLELSADTLRLTSLDEYSFDGVQAPWVKAGEGERLTLVRSRD